MKKIKRAIISLSNKENLRSILKTLNKYKIEIISSGGTYKEIKKLKYKCTEISNYTRFSEILDGRVKTLHPKIYGGILSIRNNKFHQKEMKINKFEEIDEKNYIDEIHQDLFLSICRLESDYHQYQENTYASLQTQ